VTLPAPRPRRPLLRIVVGGVPVAFTEHAIERFRLRTCPWLTHDEAIDALVTQLAHPRRHAERPSWLRETYDVVHLAATDSYLTVYRRLCFPLVCARYGERGLVAVTCIVREPDRQPAAAAAAAA
jgi:hypothetical protein